jgi:DNA polymerase III delta prime subunit
MLIGHEKIISVLVKMLALIDSPSRFRIPHAFLFYGPESVGKRTVADAFLQGLLCDGREFGGCLPVQTGLPARAGAGCAVCFERTQLGQSRDFLEIAPNENTVISIDKIRRVSAFLSRKPGIASMKAVLIDQADCMTDEASAAFLKTLEEPPGHSVLVLVTDLPGEIAETICSRLAPIRFSLVPDDEMSVFSDNIIKLADGKPGFAKKLAGDSDLLDYFEKLFARAGLMLEASDAQKIIFAGEIAKDPMVLEKGLGYLLDILRQRFSAADSAGRRASGKNARLILNAFLTAKVAGSGARLSLENALLNFSRISNF